MKDFKVITAKSHTDQAKWWLNGCEYSFLSQNVSVLVFFVDHIMILQSGKMAPKTMRKVYGTLLH